MKVFLLYWGRGYGEHEHTSAVMTAKEIKGGAFDDDVVSWCDAAGFHDHSWDFSGPVDEFMIMRVL